jgi:hypothetical protein
MEEWPVNTLNLSKKSESSNGIYGQPFTEGLGDYVKGSAERRRVE